MASKKEEQLLKRRIRERARRAAETAEETVLRLSKRRARKGHVVPSIGCSTKRLRTTTAETSTACMSYVLLRPMNVEIIG